MLAVRAHDGRGRHGAYDACSWMVGATLVWGVAAIKRSASGMAHHARAKDAIRGHDPIHPIDFAEESKNLREQGRHLTVDEQGRYLVVDS